VVPTGGHTRWQAGGRGGGSNSDDGTDTLLLYTWDRRTKNRLSLRTLV
jgi:hypothetical protein